MHKYNQVPKHPQTIYMKSANIRRSPNIVDNVLLHAVPCAAAGTLCPARQRWRGGAAVGRTARAVAWMYFVRLHRPFDLIIVFLITLVIFILIELEK